jgi:hypothetical protein
MKNKRSAPQQHQNNSKPLRYIDKAIGWAISPFVWGYRLAPIEKFTAVLCLLGGFQIWAFIQSERAFVTPTELRFDGPLVAGKEVQLVVALKNGGKGTGFITDGVSNAKFLAAGQNLPLKPAYVRAFPQSPGPVLPGGTMTMLIQPSGARGETRLTFQENDVAEIVSQKIKMYIFGFVTYDDDFSFLLGKKTTGYCFIYKPDSTILPFYNCPESAYTYAD